jgi:putative membrane protein
MKYLESNFLKLLSALVICLGGVIYVETAMPAINETPSDAQIIKIVQTANNGEIQSSKLALRSTNNEVKRLATDMIKAHTASNAEMSTLAKKMNLKSEESAKSVQLKSDTTLKTAALRPLQESDFDRKYVNDLVEAHQDVLTTLDSTLIPSAKNLELKAALEATRKTVAAHLAHAKRVRDEIVR